MGLWLPLFVPGLEEEEAGLMGTLDYLHSVSVTQIIYTRGFPLLIRGVTLYLAIFTPDLDVDQTGQPEK